MTYDQGVLELMTPCAEHEDVNRTLALFIEIVAEEWQIDVRDLGSTTFLRKEQQRGLEPDSCFYIQHEAAVRGKDKLDLSVDPPPDLARGRRMARTEFLRDLRAWLRSMACF